MKEEAAGLFWACLTLRDEGLLIPCRVLKTCEALGASYVGFRALGLLLCLVRYPEIYIC